MFWRSRLKSQNSKVEQKFFKKLGVFTRNRKKTAKFSFDFVLSWRSWFFHFSKIFGPSQNPMERFFECLQETQPVSTSTWTDCLSAAGRCLSLLPSLHWIRTFRGLFCNGATSFSHSIAPFYRLLLLPTLGILAALFNSWLVTSIQRPVCFVWLYDFRKHTSLT